MLSKGESTESCKERERPNMMKDVYSVLREGSAPPNIKLK